jgi:hypothetical protein
VLVRGGAVSAAACNAAPPSRITATARRTGSRLTNQTPAPNTTQAAATTSARPAAAGSPPRTAHHTSAPSPATATQAPPVRAPSPLITTPTSHGGPAIGPVAPRPSAIRKNWAAPPGRQDARTAAGARPSGGFPAQRRQEEWTASTQPSAEPL